MECFYNKALESAEVWPVYTYTVRNLAPICDRFIKYNEQNSIIDNNETLIKLIKSLATAGNFCDDEDKITFHIVSTKRAHKTFSLDKVIQETCINNGNSGLFSPLVILASQAEAENLLSLLEPLSESLYPFVVAFLTNENDNSDRIQSESIPFLTTKEDEIFSKLDATLIEKMVFQLASSMAKSLTKVLQPLSESNTG